MLYLTVGDDDIGLNILAFLPQVVLLLLLTYKYSSIYEVNFCLFCQTLVFVTFNKVHCTKVALLYLVPINLQYFLRLLPHNISCGTCLCCPWYFHHCVSQLSNCSLEPSYGVLLRFFLVIQ